MASVPAVAVILPVYNRADVVGRAVRSVLAQDFAEFELIVVDDGSTDGSAELVAGIEDRRIRLIRLGANGGSNAARNAGVRAASAPIVAFLDSDDVYLPHKLGTVHRIFAARPELDVLLDSFIKRDGRRERRRHNPVINDSRRFATALFSRRLWKATSAISVRREAAIRAGLFDETLTRRQDLDFLARLARTATCASSDAVLWVKHWTPGSISDNVASYATATVELTRRYPEYRSDPALRSGLSRDLARHFARLLLRGRVRAARRDTRILAREFGRAELRRLRREGARELVARHLQRWFRLRRRL